MFDTGWRPDFKCSCGYEEASAKAQSYVRCPRCGVIARVDVETMPGTPLNESGDRLIQYPHRDLREILILMEVEAMDWPDTI